MSSSGVIADPLAERLSLIRPHLDRQEWPLLLGAEAKALGRGRIKAVVAVNEEVDRAELTKLLQHRRSLAVTGTNRLPGSLLRQRR